MRIFAVGRNYQDHISELKNQKPSAPVVFTKPDTAILRNNAPFYYPSFSKDIHHEVELVIRISKEGKSIEEKFASKYYDAVAIGIDFTARDLQDELKKQGLPWDIAKGFNGSAPLSEFIPLDEIKDIHHLSFSLKLNNNTVQQGSTQDMIFGIDGIISYISTFFTLRKGDVIFTGTPSGVGPVKIGDRLIAYLEDKEMLNFEIK
ncbi:MAG: hydrolase family protein [Chitinophagaceae bacterium]|nr:hydrolase family protein [Chitinophagaceae bacterium]